MSFPPLFVISLTRSTDRRRTIAARLEALGLAYQFFDAVEGRGLDAKALACYSPLRRRLFFGHDLTKGEIGCLLSHRGIYEQIVAQNIAHALILEDDAILEDDFEEVIRALLKDTSAWDIVRMIGAEKVYRLSRSIGPLTNKHEIIRARGTPGGACAYLLNQKAAQVLLEKMRLNWLPVDTLLGQIWRTHLKVLAVKPSPVSTDDMIESTIGAERFDKTLNLTLGERLIYPFSRLGWKLYEMAGKKSTWFTTRKQDRVLGERLRRS